MVEFPEIARRRLNRVPDGIAHPDPGLLTALVEGTLAKSHRESVFNHLAACSECNRLLMLITPEHESAPVVAVAGERRGWLAWAPLRWIAAGAAAAVVAGTIWMGRVEQRIQVPAAPSVAVEKAPAINTPSPSQVAVERAPALPSKVSRETAKPREVAKATPGPEQPQPPQFNAAIAAQSRPAAPGNVSNQNAFQTSMMSGVSAPPGTTVAPPEPLPAAPKPEPTAVAKPNIPLLPAQPAGPILAISDVGVLQRSNDGGRSWAAVPVPSRTTLRALSAFGQEIWIGGDRGTLYHSSDAGQSWASVALSSNGEVVSADIVRIAFSDPQHGWIATRGGEVWITRDSGTTWSRK